MKSVVTIMFLLCVGITVSAWAQGGSADKGKAIVDGKHCAMCHKAGGMGKALDALAGTNNDAYLSGALLTPKKTIGPTVKMPAYKLTDDQVKDVIAYLRSLKH